jgi:hypothetical protein
VAVSYEVSTVGWMLILICCCSCFENETSNRPAFGTIVSNIAQMIGVSVTESDAHYVKASDMANAEFYKEFYDQKKSEEPVSHSHYYNTDEQDLKAKAELEEPNYNDVKPEEHYNA